MTTITPQNNKKKSTAYKQSKNEEETARGRDKEKQRQRFHTFDTMASLFQGMVARDHGQKYFKRT